MNEQIAAASAVTTALRNFTILSPLIGTGPAWLLLLNIRLTLVTVRK